MNNIPVTSYKRDFLAKNHDRNQLQLTYFTHTQVTININKSHDLGGKNQEILYKTADSIMPDLKKIENSLMSSDQILSSKNTQISGNLYMSVFYIHT